MKSIPLTKGLETIVDDEDFLRFGDLAWHAMGRPGQHYAARSAPRGPGLRLRLLHREILGLEAEDIRDVDHINGVRLDNRRKNLRIVSRRQNLENRRDKSSYGPGVYLRRGRFEAQVYWQGSRRHLGTFDTAYEALSARRRFLDTHTT